MMSKTINDILPHLDGLIWMIGEDLGGGMIQETDTEMRSSESIEIIEIFLNVNRNCVTI